MPPEPIEGVAVAARLAQFAGAMLLFGSPVFFLRNFDGRTDPPHWTRRLLGFGVLLLLTGGGAFALAQTALMVGEAAAAFRPADIASVLADTQLGRGLSVRLALAAAAGLVLMLPLGARARWSTLALLGAAIAASFAWTGHGAATEGAGRPVHLAADVLHLLAAGLWLGALPPLLLLVRRAQRSESSADEARFAHDALHGFSGVGTLAVTLLVATGLVNAWFLVGPDRIGALAETLYGQLLLVKLALVALMLALAAANRFRLTPALGRRLAGPDQALAALRRSVAVETAAGLLVLAAVAWLGTLAPPAAA